MATAQKKPQKNLAFGQRVAERMKALKYWNPRTDKPDYYRFGMEKGYFPSAVHRWWNGEIPRAATLHRFAQHLKCEPGYLLFGTPRPARNRGGSSGENPLPVLGPSGLHADTHTIEAKYLKRKKSSNIMLSHGPTVARRLLSYVPATARGTHRVAA